VVCKAPASSGISDERLKVFVSTSAELVVGTGEVVFSATVTPRPSQEWVNEHVKVEGPRQPVFSDSAGRLTYTFPEGPPGETMTVSITGVQLANSGEDSLVLSLTRVAEPGVVLEAKVPTAASTGAGGSAAGGTGSGGTGSGGTGSGGTGSGGTGTGAWRPLATSDCLGDQPVEMRARFTEDMDRASVEAVLERQGNDLGASVGPVTWTDARTVEFTLPLPEPPSVVRFCFWEARDTRGLKVVSTVWRLYPGPMPRLHALDPVTGRETALCSLPADVYHAAVSPDGQTLYYVHYLERSMDTRAVLVRTGDGSTQALDAGYSYNPGWVGGRYLLRSARAQEPDRRFEVISPSGEIIRQGPLPWGLHYLSVSPDGTRLAGYLVDETGPASDEHWWLEQLDLVVVDLQTGATRTLHGFATRYEEVGAYVGGEQAGGPFWSPDSRLLAVISNMGPGQGSVIRVLNLDTGEVEEEVGLADAAGQSTVGSWSPDGRHWTAGPVLLRVAPPHEAATLSVACGRNPEWSPDGRWLAVNSRLDGWGETVLYRVRATGDPASSSVQGPLEPEPVEERSLGNVFPCGWDSAGRFYFIRWTSYELRYEPSLATTGFD